MTGATTGGCPYKIVIINSRVRRGRPLCLPSYDVMHALSVHLKMVSGL